MYNIFKLVKSNILQFKGEFGASIDPLDLNNALEQGGIKTRAGWNINILRGNLEKEVVVK
ncbi:MAG: hypothetical protein QM490_00480 [Candidatus Gracilibacteria bacterium]